MRYLFTTIPGASHMLPMVPLAHAALAAGHDVLVATSGPALRVAVEAGLPAAAVDNGDAARPYEELGHRITAVAMGRAEAEAPFSDTEFIAYVGSVFGRVGALMVDGLLDVATKWDAGAVVYCAPHVAGLVTARALRVPAVLHGIGTPRPTFVPALRHLDPAVRRLGLTEVRDADVELDLSPPSLEKITQDSPQRNDSMPTLAMRYTPYNGGAVLPPWALERSVRPRMVATLGSIPTIYGDGEILRELVLGTKDLDIELVLTTGGAEMPALPSPVPDHVRLVDWIPLRALLRTCDAIIHHGGMGTMYAAFDAGVPQLSLTLPDDSLANARIATGRGTGTMLPMSDATAAAVGPAVRDLLADPAYRLASREVAAEMREMPAPGTVIGLLTDFLHSVHHRP
jgi:glycosyltransferase